MRAYRLVGVPWWRHLPVSSAGRTHGHILERAPRDVADVLRETWYYAKKGCLAPVVADTYRFLSERTRRMLAFPPRGGVWAPPIGIPMPSFGITEAAGAATETVTTLSGTKTLSPGDVIQIDPGTYTADVIFTGGGTAGNPAVVRGVAGNLPSISGAWNTSNGGGTIGLVYTIFENLVFEGASSAGIGVVGTGTHHLCVRDCTFRDLPFVSANSATGITPAQGAVINDILFLRCVFNNLGMNFETWDFIDQDYHGIGLSLYSRTPPTEIKNVWVLECDGQLISGNLIQTTGRPIQDASEMGYINHIYVGRCTGGQNRQAPIGLKQCVDIVCSQNTFNFCRGHGGSAGEAIAYQYAKDRMWLIFNHFFDCGNGTRASDSGASDATMNSYMIGNLIHDTYQNPTDWLEDYPHWGSPNGWGITRHAAPGGNLFTVNNTLANVHNGIECVFNPDGMHSLNDIIAFLKAPEGGAPQARFTNMGQAPGAYMSMDYALLHPGVQSWFTRWAQATYTTLAGFQSGQGQCAHATTNDPLFVAAPQDNYRLLTGSPAKDAGTLAAAYATFLANYGISVQVDQDNGDRPRGDGWDMGAFELVAQQAEGSLVGHTTTIDRSSWRYG